MEGILGIHAFEYAAGLFTVIIGLAVVDLATSFHKLARHRHAVAWDPLVLLGALYSLLLVITMWFKIWGIRDIPEIRHYLFYLTACAEYFLLFLIAAASLPDEPQEACDLRKYYNSNHQYLWILMVLYQLFNLGHAVYFYTHGLHTTWTHIILSCAVPTLASMVLLATRARKVHYIGLVLLMGLLLFDRSADIIG